MIPPLFILGSLCLLFGVGLYIASHVFKVEVDPRVKQIEEALPGANCGSCGFAGCSAYAKAIVQGSADVTACAPGGEETARLIADIMGVTVKVEEKNVAVLKCQGRNVGNAFEYEGVKTCRAAALVHGGPKNCVFGCIGFGDCAEACPFDAITISNGFPEVDEKRCTGCGKCVEICPKGLFELKPLTKFVHVRCASHYKPKETRKNCEVGCIACGRCKTACEFNAIIIEDNLSRIDYEKCTNCGKCVEVCPTNAIKNYRLERKEKGLLPC